MLIFKKIKMKPQNAFLKFLLKLAIVILISFGGLFLIFFSYYFWQLTYGKTDKIKELDSTFNANFSLVTESTKNSRIENWETLIKNYNPKIGEDSSPVKIIVFFDFQCEYCQKDYQTILKIKDKFPISQIIFKYTPILNDETSTSLNSALASACANEQNYFWQYYEKLFTTEEKSLDNLYLIAQDLKLDLATFENCLTTKKYKNNINQDLQDFNNFKVRGTPTYIINGEILEGIQTEEKWTETILKNINN